MPIKYWFILADGTAGRRVSIGPELIEIGKFSKIDWLE